MIAERKGIKLNVFPLQTSSVPYGYSPVVLAHPSLLLGNKMKTLKNFLSVCEKSYQFCAAYPTESAEILLTQANHPTLNELGIDFLIESQKRLSTSGSFLTATGQWGCMDPARWSTFIDWLFANNCLVARDGSVIQRYFFQSTWI